MYDQFDIRVHDTTVSRILQKHCWVREEAKQNALEASATLRETYLTKVARYPTDRLVFLDESAWNERTGYRKRGWSPAGADCKALLSTKWYERWSILPALMTNGYLLNPLILQLGLNQQSFNWFVVNRVLPHLHPGIVIVLGNAPFHHDPLFKAAVEAAGHQLLYLPPYSMDLNPIERAFKMLKAWLKKNMAMATVFRDLASYLAYAMQGVIGNVDEHFRESGYR